MLWQETKQKRNVGEMRGQQQQNSPNLEIVLQMYAQRMC